MVLTLHEVCSLKNCIFAVGCIGKEERNSEFVCDLEFLSEEIGSPVMCEFACQM